jgi:hypothetical protein
MHVGKIRGAAVFSLLGSGKKENVIHNIKMLHSHLYNSHTFI